VAGGICEAGEDCPAARRRAAKTRRLHELSIEVLTSYELAGIANISEGYDIGLDRTPVSA